MSVRRLHGVELGLLLRKKELRLPRLSHLLDQLPLFGAAPGAFFRVATEVAYLLHERAPDTAQAPAQK